MTRVCYAAVSATAILLPCCVLDRRWLRYYLAHDSTGPTKGVAWEHTAPHSAFAVIQQSNSIEAGVGTSKELQTSRSQSSRAATASMKTQPHVLEHSSYKTNTDSSGNGVSRGRGMDSCPVELFSLYSVAQQAGLPVDDQPSLECLCSEVPQAHWQLQQRQQQQEAAPNAEQDNANDTAGPIELVQASEADKAPVAAVRVNPEFTRLSSILQVVNTSLEALQWFKTKGGLAMLPLLPRGKSWIRARQKVSLWAVLSTVEHPADFTWVLHALLAYPGACALCWHMHAPHANSNLQLTPAYTALHLLTPVGIFGRLAALTEPCCRWLHNDINGSSLCVMHLRLLCGRQPASLQLVVCGSSQAVLRASLQTRGRLANKDRGLAVHNVDQTVLYQRPRLLPLEGCQQVGTALSQQGEQCASKGAVLGYIWGTKQLLSEPSTTGAAQAEGKESSVQHLLDRFATQLLSTAVFVCHPANVRKR